MAACGCCTSSQHREDVGQLIDELAAAGSAALGVSLDSGVQERLCAYARSGVWRTASVVVDTVKGVGGWVG
jgi:hypothetical protein